MKRSWSPAAEAKLRELYATTPLPRLAFLLKRTPVAIKSRANRLGLTKGNRQRWTAAMDRQLAALYATKSAQECADALGVGLSAVHNRVHTLGLSKSAEWVSERTRKRWAEGRHENSRKAQFRPGQEPPNKGRPQAEWMPAASRARCRRTQFKPGRPAHEARNYKPIGSLRVLDGVLQRKVTDDPGVYPARRWRPVHALVWEQHNGPVPAGHFVRFRRGMATTREDAITVDRLELVNRAENMRRNSYWNNYPREVAELNQLRGALTTKINRKRKDREEQSQRRA